MNLGPIAKAVVGTVLAGVGAVTTALEGDGAITWPEGLAIAGTVLTASIAIWYVTNGGRLGDYAKAIITSLVSGLGSISVSLSVDGALSVTEILIAVGLLLNGLIVAQTPNAEESDDLVVHDLADDDPEFARHVNLDPA